jgi:A/G-specific adenine glycosylase
MSLKSDAFNDSRQDSSLTHLILTWYSEKRRDLPWRKTKDPYAIWVSEVMLQQTQVKTVIPYFERFLQRFPDVKQLAASSLEEVLTIWSGLGYYSRARRMWEGARYICDQLGGEMPKAYDSLLLVPGIGQYTAGAIASIAFGQRVSAIDGNVLRVVSRLLAWPEPVEMTRTQRHFRNQLEKWQPAHQPGDFNQALMELGAMVCTPRNQDCGGCPLALVCKGHLQDDVRLYPVKKPKAKRQIVTRLTFVLRQGDRVYLQKRPSQGLLADLWEFPGVELSQDDDSKESISRDEGFELFQRAVSKRIFDSRVRQQFEQDLSLRGPVWYTFSHRRWKIIWTVVNVPGDFSSLRESDGKYRLDTKDSYSLEVDACWVALQDLTEIALPVAFTSIVEDLTK